MYYRNANCAVVVYDITQAVWSNPASYLRLITSIEANIRETAL
jgi:GTPase SAR1 family protein